MKVFKSKQGKEKVHKVYKEMLSKWPVENNQYTVETNYGDTFVIESGLKENPALVLIHGSVASSYCWMDDVKTYSDYFNVYAIDIIGEAGFSAENRPDYRSGDYKEWLKEVLDGLSIETASIIGISLGGWMSLSFATQYPKRIDNLILLCSGGLYPEKKSFLIKAILYSFLGKWGSRQINKMLNGGKEPDYNDENIRKVLDYTTLISNNFNPRTDKLPIYSSHELSRLTMPVLAIYGENDCMMDVKNSIEHLRNSTPTAHTVILPDTGHVITSQTKRNIKFIRASMDNDKNSHHRKE